MLKGWSSGTKHFGPYDLCYFIIVTPFPGKAFIIKGNVNNWRISPSYPFSCAHVSFLDIAFIKEESTGCVNEGAIGAINEAVQGAIIAPEIYLLVVLFDVLLFQLHHQLIDRIFLVTILIILSISSFEINKVKSFPALTTLLSCIFLSSLSIVNEATLVANLGKSSLRNSNV